MIKILFCLVFFLLEGSISAPAALVGEWMADEGGGARVKDGCGRSDGTIVGAKWVADRKGNPAGAIQFCDAKDQVVCGKDVSLNLTGDLTLEIWIKPDSVEPEFQQILRKGDVKAAYALFIMRQNISLRSHAQKWGALVQTKNNPLRAGEWVQIVVVREYSGQTATGKIYINGELQATGTREGMTVSVPDDKFFIGSLASEPKVCFKGCVGTVRVFNHVLSAEKVKLLRDGKFAEVLDVPFASILDGINGRIEALPEKDGNKKSLYVTRSGSKLRFFHAFG
ncbi:MAG: LamG domain-containing protein [Verrucomicrobiae bacterium]|nr:LamG domain-containing protein [Verrucomicrobiae bacterium]